MFIDLFFITSFFLVVCLSIYLYLSIRDLFAPIPYTPQYVRWIRLLICLSVTAMLIYYAHSLARMGSYRQDLILSQRVGIIVLVSALSTGQLLQILEQRKDKQDKQRR